MVTTFSTAHGYECSHVKEEDKTSITQVWRQTCIPFFVSSQSGLFAEQSILDEVIASFDKWSSAQQSCTSLSFDFAGTLDDGIGFDRMNASNNHNVITSVDSEAELTELMSKGLWPDKELVAITLTTYEPTSGEILDADISLNNVVFSLENIAEGTSCGNNAKRHDIGNTLVHEVGHFIGFAHVPDSEATLFSHAKDCETKKRSLGEDDILGLCSVYPSAGPIVTCIPPIVGYDGVNTQAYQGQCARFNQEPIEGCDCSSLRLSDQAPRLGALFLLLGVVILGRRKLLS
jgi:hypothetical protein